MNFKRYVSLDRGGIGRFVDRLCVRKPLRRVAMTRLVRFPRFEPFSKTAGASEAIAPIQIRNERERFVIDLDQRYGVIRDIATDCGDRGNFLTGETHHIIVGDYDGANPAQPRRPAKYRCF